MPEFEPATLQAVLGTADGVDTAAVPTVTTFTDGLRRSMLPWAPAGSDFDSIDQASAAMFEQVWQIVADQGSPDVPDTYQAGWSVLLDPVACAVQCPQFLPFTALFVGAQVPPGTSPAAAVATILAEQGMARSTGFGGTYTSANGTSGGAIIIAAQKWLSGDQQITLLERTAADGSEDAYHFVITVRPEQVVDEAALVAAVNNIKPGGVMWTLVEVDGYTWAEAENTWSADDITWQSTDNTRP